MQERVLCSNIKEDLRESHLPLLVKLSYEALGDFSKSNSRAGTLL